MEQNNNDIIIEVKGKQLRLVLDQVALEYAEDLLDKSIAGIFINMISGMSQESINELENINEENFMKILGLFKLPKVRDMKAIIIASSKRYNHGVTDKDILEELEDTSVFDMFSIVLPLLMNSKILPKS